MRRTFRTVQIFDAARGPLALAAIALASSALAAPATSGLAGASPEPSLRALKEEVTKPIFEKRRNEIWGCYEKARQSDPLLKGKLTLRVDVAADGSIDQASVEGTDIRNDDLQRCLVDAAKTLNFKDAPIGANGGVARYTVNFVRDPTLEPIKSAPKAGDDELDPSIEDLETI